MGVGSLVDVSLAEARQKAGEARRQRAEGIDPIEARVTQRALRRAGAMTFDQCCEGYVVAHRAGWSTNHERVWKASIRDYVTPVFGKLLVLLSQNAAFEVFENHIMKEIPVGT
jgi:Arm DNA-binding domain